MGAAGATTTQPQPLRLWTVVPILPHLLCLWLPGVWALLLRRCWVFLCAAARALPRLAGSRGTPGIPRGTPAFPPAPLAVIIPCHNAAKDIRGVVARARRDGQANVRLFAVDSGSTDATWEVLQQMQRNKEVRVGEAGTSDRAARGLYRGAAPAGLHARWFAPRRSAPGAWCGAIAAAGTCSWR